MKKFITLFMSLLLCMTMCLVVSAEEVHDHTHAEALSFDALVELAAVSYPTCPNCGGTTRNFYSTGSSSHNVRCRSCNYLLITEACWALTEATCESPSICICNREIDQPTGHSTYITPLSDSMHGQVCSNYGCQYNPYSFYFAGPFYSQLHAINLYDYEYDYYYHSKTGERWHTKEGYCYVCQYSYYDTTICLYPNDLICGGARCFGDSTS